MNKKFWIVFAALVIGALGFAIIQSKKSSGTTRKLVNPTQVQADDHIRGKVGSKVYMITYGDYECPACNAWEPTLEQIKDEFGDRVEFIFRNFPLTDKHINAFAAARAAEAANLQGKFWEMHDLLYAKNTVWAGQTKSAQSTFEGYAAQLGLNMDQFRKDYVSNAVADRINSDLVSATKVGATGTPTFLINGQLIQVDNVATGKDKIRQILTEKLAQ